MLLIKYSLISCIFKYSVGKKEDQVTEGRVTLSGSEFCASPVWGLQGLSPFDQLLPFALGNMFSSQLNCVFIFDNIAQLAIKDVSVSWMHIP